MDSQTLKSIIEGLLFMAGDEGLTAKQLAEILDETPDEIASVVRLLRIDLNRGKRGVRVMEVAGAYRMTTNPEHVQYFERMAYSPSRVGLSQAALEALSIVAYRQPITRIEIEEIRGVKSERALHSLVMKDLIEEVGRADAPGRPILYGTTRSFLEYFGLSGLDSLPDPESIDEQELLEEQTQLLFEKLEDRQITIDEFQVEEDN